jgi:hypothetical protein
MFSRWTAQVLGIMTHEQGVADVLERPLARARRVRVELGERVDDLLLLLDLGPHAEMKIRLATIRTAQRPSIEAGAECRIGEHQRAEGEVHVLHEEATHELVLAERRAVLGALRQQKHPRILDAAARQHEAARTHAKRVASQGLRLDRIQRGLARP